MSVPVCPHFLPVCTHFLPVCQSLSQSVLDNNVSPYLAEFLNLSVSVSPNITYLSLSVLIFQLSVPVSPCLSLTVLDNIV